MSPHIHFTHDSSALNLIMMISHLDTIIDKNTIPDLSCIISHLTLDPDISHTDITDFPEFGFNFQFSQYYHLCRNAKFNFIRNKNLILKYYRNATVKKVFL